MSCVMSRPSAPPTERMKDARDFLYWLNHVSYTHKHAYTRAFTIIVRVCTMKFKMLLLLTFLRI